MVTFEKTAQHIYAPNPHERHVCNVFLPLSGSNWPVLIEIDVSGFATGNLVEQVTTSQVLANAALSNGFAYVHAICTVYGQPGIAGSGIWIPPTHWLHSQRHFAEKDACLLSQFVDQLAPTYGWNAARKYLRGNSAGSMAMAFAALGPERMGQDGYWSTGKSRSRAAVITRHTSWWNAFDQEFEPQAPHFARFEDYDQPTPLLRDVSLSDQISASSLYYGFVDAKTRELNQRMPVFVYSDDPPTGAESLDITDSSVAGEYVGDYITDTLTDKHSVWGSAALFAQLIELDSWHSGASFFGTAPGVGVGLVPAPTNGSIPKSALDGQIANWILGVQAKILAGVTPVKIFVHEQGLAGVAPGLSFGQAGTAHAITKHSGILGTKTSGGIR